MTEKAIKKHLHKKKTQKSTNKLISNLLIALSVMYIL